MKILGCEWKLRTGPLNVAVHGFMDAIRGELTINENTDATWHTYLLLHEVLHALIFMGHLQFLKLDGDVADDEAKLDAIASLLSEFLVSNSLINLEGVMQCDSKT